MFLPALFGNRWGLKPLGTNGLRCFASYGLSGVDVLAGFVWQPLGAEALGDQRDTLLCELLIKWYRCSCWLCLATVGG